MRSHRFFNTICFVVGILLLVGTVYFLRDVFVRNGGSEHASGIPAVRYEDILEEKKEQSDALNTEDTQEDVPEASTSDTATTPLSLEDSFPKQINLAVPFTSQAPEGNWDQPWQDACEEAAVLMLDAYYKGYNIDTPLAKDELVNMVDWEENVQGWGRSIEIEKVQSTYEWFAGANVIPMMIVEDPTVDELKEFLAAGHPVLVVADGKVLPNPHFQNGGPEYHALIIRGYTEDAFITNDPGTKFGEQFLYAYDDLMNAIRDWNGGDVKNGRRVVLVAE